MEQDTEEAFEKHRELVKLLVEKIALSRNEEGRTNVDSPTDSDRLPPQWGSKVRMVSRTRCGWVKHIPVDKRVAHEKALARKMWEDFLIRKNMVRLRHMEERGNACQICGLDSWLGDPIMLEMHRKTRTGATPETMLFFSVPTAIVLPTPGGTRSAGAWRNR